MARRTASRAKAPRCASENRVQPVVVSSSTGRAGGHGGGQGDAVITTEFYGELP